MGERVNFVSLNWGEKTHLLSKIFHKAVTDSLFNLTFERSLCSLRRYHCGSITVSVIYLRMLVLLYSYQYHWDTFIVFQMMSSSSRRHIFLHSLHTGVSVCACVLASVIVLLFWHFCKYFSFLFLPSWLPALHFCVFWLVLRRKWWTVECRSV